jgi:acyl carrier protein
MNIQEFITKFAEMLEIEEVDALTPETLFRDLDEWSSISVMEFIAFADENYGKQVGDSHIRTCQTIQDLYNLVMA